MSNRTAIQTKLTEEEVQLLKQWRSRCATGTFSPAITGLRSIRVMGRSGDTPVMVPCIPSMAAIETLKPDERFALTYAERLVVAFQQRGRSIFADGQLVQGFDPLARQDLLVLSPIAGGTR